MYAVAPVNHSVRVQSEWMNQQGKNPVTVIIDNTPDWGGQVKVWSDGGSQVKIKASSATTVDQCITELVKFAEGQVKTLLNSRYYAEGTYILVEGPHTLSFEGETLSGSKSLEECGIKNGSLINQTDRKIWGAELCCGGCCRLLTIPPGAIGVQLGLPKVYQTPRRQRSTAPTTKNMSRDDEAFSTKDVSVAMVAQNPPLLEQLKQLAELKQQGVLTEDEFNKAKGKLL